jgi:hypothetical protein
MRLPSNAPRAPKASRISRKLQSILNRIRDHGIECELITARHHISRLTSIEDRLDQYSQILLDELREEVKSASKRDFESTGGSHGQCPPENLHPLSE